MKQTQLKDALRNIWKQKVSWFAIVVIAMLSVMAYLGIHFASRGIADNANRFYDETHFRDAEIISTLLVTQDDISILRSVDGVSDVEGVFQTSGKIENNNLRQNVDVVSLTQRISIPRLLEGRLPETAFECVVEPTVLEGLELSVGDTIRITDAKGERAEYLLRDEFVITGVVNHGDHATWPTEVPGNRDVVVLPEAFDRDALGDCFMKAELLFEGTAGLDRFGEAYKNASAAVMERINELQAERMAIRSSEVQAQAQQQIDAGQAELDQAQTQLEAGRAELDEGWRAFEDGEKQIRDGDAQLAEGKKQLEEGKEQLDASSVQLNQAQRELQSAKNVLDAANAELESAKEPLDAGKAELIDGFQELEDIKAAIRDRIHSKLSEVLGSELADSISWASVKTPDVDNSDETAMDLWITTDTKFDFKNYLEFKIEVTETVSRLLHEENIPEEVLIAAYEQITGLSEESYDLELVRSELADYAASQIGSYTENVDELANGCLRWDEGHDTYLNGKAEYDEAFAKYQDGLAEYEAGLAKYRAGQAAYQSGLQQYNLKVEEYEQGLADLEQARTVLSESRKKLEDGEQQYEDGQAEFEAGAKRLEDAKARLASLDECRWVVLNIEGNAGYLFIQNGVNNTADMGMTFALMFILIAALVIYATVGRIVDEQRRLVGATKALGLYNREIFTKYLAFGVSATVLGMLLGVAAGYFGIQRILLYTYGRFYVFGSGKSMFLGGMTAVVLLAGTALAFISVWSASSTLMRSTATNLMQEKAPDISHKEGRSGRRALSLYSRLILLNMLTDKKRVVVTVVSVAGCCALLVAGFTMRQSVIKALNAQFDEVAKYDMQILFDPEVSADAREELETLLTDAGTDWSLVHSALQTYQVNGRLLGANLLCGDLSELDRFYARLDPEIEDALPRDAEGVWIHQRTAEINGLSAGDSIELYDRGMKPYSVPVAGVFRIYVGQEMILAEDQYQKIFGEMPIGNCYVLYLNGVDAQALKTAAWAIKGVEEITDTAETRATYQSFASVLNLIALLMVGIAGLMAYFILLNLVNMFINQKKRELTIMRVNGFTVREVKMYVLREMILSTVLGIALGLGAGSLLGYRVIRLLENASLRLFRDIQWEAWVFGALITAIYAVIINMAALRKVKDLKLTDVA